MNKLPFVRCFAALIFILSASSGCSRPNPNPELLDPIYKDLLSKAKEYSKAAEEGEKQIEAARKSVDEALPQSVDLKIARKELKKALRTHEEAEQLARYFEIRAERRKVEGRKAYKEAFEKDQPWPDPREYDFYQTHQKLREAPRTWSSRVPKLRDRLPSSQEK